MSGRGDSEGSVEGVSLARTLQPATTTLAGQLSEGMDESAFAGSLLVIAGAQADIGTHVLVDDAVVIGREPDGLQLRDGRCSRRHVRVSPDSDDHWLEDLGSTNGTLLNGARVVAPERLHDGDRIRVGQTTLKFTLVDPTEAAYLRRMEQLASRDALTGLLANHRFSSLLGEAFRTARSFDTSLVAMMMDLDGLKAINDRHGHRMGAQTIRLVGRIIGEETRGRGEATRFGGDEFCVFLPRVDRARAMQVAERIRHRVEATPFVLGETTVRATMSIGLAVATPSMQDWTELQEAADRALYRAKEGGRNRIAG